MKYWIVVYTFSIVLISSMFTSCKELNSFSEEEIEIISRYENSVMPLQTVNDDTDSLFLREESLPLTFDDVKSIYFKDLTQQMHLTVNNPINEGVGIAAPQVGISRRVVAVQRFDKDGEPFEIYVNPQIVFTSEKKQKGWEGCLSVPGKRGEVERAAKIVVEYNNLVDFKIERDTIEGFTAIIFQHEIDHLDGILYIDKAESIEIK